MKEQRAWSKYVKKLLLFFLNNEKKGEYIYLPFFFCHNTL